MRQNVRLIVATAIMLATVSQSHAAEAMRTSFRNAGLMNGRGGSCGCETRGCDARPTCGCEARPSCGCDARPTCGCGVATCDSSCGVSAPCCPRILPAIVKTLDCFLTQALGDPCNAPCPRPRCGRPTCCSDAWTGYGVAGGCGCGSAPMEQWTPAPPKAMPSQAAEGNPFEDDDLKKPPMPPKETRVLRSPAQAAGLTSHRHQKAAPKSIATIPASRPTPAVHVSGRATPKLARVPRPVKQIDHEEDAAHELPKNPLRDE